MSRMLVAVVLLAGLGCEHDEERQAIRDAWARETAAEVCSHLPADGGGLLPYGCAEECQRRWAQVQRDISEKPQFAGVTEWGWMRECVYHCCERMPSACRAACQRE